MRSAAMVGESFSTLSEVSSDDRRIDAVSGDPAVVRETNPRPVTTAGRKKKAVDPRDETVSKSAPSRAPSGTKARVASEPAIQAPAIQEPGPQTSAIHLPPIQLQPEPDPVPVLGEPVQWVPTVVVPPVRPPAAPIDSGFDPSGEHVPETWLAAQRPRSTRLIRRGRTPRPRVRRVTRVVRHVDPWSVFKIALCFSAVLYGICLTSGVLLWNVAYTTGTVDNLEKFFESFGWNSFHFKGGQLYHNAWIIGLFAALGLTGLALLTATLFNLITDLVGGIRVTVLEEEVIERSAMTAGPLLGRRSRRGGTSGGTSS